MKSRKSKLILICFIVIILICFTVLACLFIYPKISESIKAKKIEIQLSLGERYLSELDYEQAVTAYNNVIEIDPVNVDAYYGMVSIYIEEEEYKKAKNYIEKGQETITNQRFTDSVEEKIEEKITDGYNYLADKEYEEALEVFNNILQMEFKEKEAYIGIIDVYFEQGDKENVEKYANRGLKETEDSIFSDLFSIKLKENLEKGNTYLENKEYDKALEKFNNLLSMDPLYADAYIGLVNTYNNQGEYVEALQMAKDACEVIVDENFKAQVDEINDSDIYDDDDNLLKRCIFNKRYSKYWVSYVYDVQGNMLEVTTYNETGIVDQYEIMYDEKGRCTKSYTLNFSGRISQVLCVYSTMEYDEQNNRIAFKEYGSDGSCIYNNDCEYDAQGNMISKIEYYNEYLGCSSFYEYDEKGNVISSKRQDSFDVTPYVNKYQNEYDENDNLIITRRYSEEGDLLNTYEYEYDEKGNTIYSSDSSDSYENSYDENGNLNMREYFNSEGILYTRYKYDENGNEIMWMYIDSDGNVSQHVEWDYDEFGQRSIGILYVGDLPYF